jgi:hypothetical protein
MIWRALVVALALGVTPALAQDTSSSSASSEASSADLSSSSAELLPASPGDTDLELVVRAAYNGAAAFAVAHGNYFARDEVFAPLHDAVRAELLEEGYGAATVPDAPPPDLAAARACLAAPGTELRIVTTTFGDGISLIAVTDTRDFAYVYDPREAADIKISPAEPCLKPN